MRSLPPSERRSEATRTRQTFRPSTSLSGTSRLPFAGRSPVLDRVKNTRLEGEGKAVSGLDRLVQIRERR